VFPEEKMGCDAARLFTQDIVKMYVCHGVDEGVYDTGGICTGYGPRCRTVLNVVLQALPWTAQIEERKVRDEYLYAAPSSRDPCGML
jgi:hypothetical protein